MFNSGNCASVPLVASLNGNGNNGNGGNGNGLFDNGAWIIIILFLFVFLGWGNNWGGNGNNGGNGGGCSTPTYIPIPTNVGGATDSDMQRGFNQQAVIGKLDGITQGVCDSTYAVTRAVNTLGTNVMQGFSQAELSRCNQQAALMQQLFAMQAASQNCCCETQRLMERGFADTNYNMATQACDTRNTIQNTTRDIIESQNAGTRAVLDALTQQRLEAKDEKIASQAQQITALQFAASQANQNAFITANQEAQTAELIRRLGKDYPVNAVVVQPNTPVTFPVNCCGQFNGYGYNNGCGCSGCGNC